MASLPEFVGTVHIFLGPYRGNPIALYLQRDEATCHIAPRIYPWNGTIGSGETPNKAAAAFEAKWKENDLSAEMYSGPHWEGGIKPEKPKPPPKPAAPKPATPAKTDAAKPSAPAVASTEGSAQPTAAQPNKDPEQATPKAQTPTLSPAPPQTSTSPPASTAEKLPESTQPPSPETT